MVDKARAYRRRISPPLRTYRRGTYIGTSGWNYPHWKEVFYPFDLTAKNWLTFYAQTFPAVELNYSFYRLPKEETYAKWYKLTPPGFIFSLKASRFITHIKRLKDCQGALDIFLKNAETLGEKKGPIFFQLPPSFKKDLDRLVAFCESLPAEGRFAFEFRHPSWFDEEVYQFLRKRNLALIFSDTPRYPYIEEVTADFIYLRLHGHEKLYASKYTDVQLKEYAKKVKNWQKIRAVYVFFDNDFSGYAVENAQELLKLLN